ncbi:MAG: GGDEF domain-containing protein, partial [Arenimonas sp.]
ELAELDARDARLESRRHAQDSERMELLAHTDVLTGLPNRRAFISRWEDELARSARRAYPLGLLLIDADRFKSVNDHFGHSKGDAVLRAIGAALQEVARSEDSAARLGGDEFALVVSHCHGQALLAMAANIRRMFAQATAQLGVDTTLSIGIVSSDTCPRLRMLAEADAELYRSKAAGGDRAQMSTCAETEVEVP